MVNADSYDARTESLADLTDSIQARLGVDIYERRANADRRGKLHTAVSPGYFQEAVLQLFTGRERAKWYVSPNRVNRDYTRLPDGSFTYSSGERASDSAAVMRKAIKYVQPPIFQIGENKEVSTANLVAIEKLINLIRKNGAEVEIYLPPYHPYVYNQISGQARYRIINDGETAIREMAGRKSVTVLGSFNPHKYGFVNTDFYDGHHLREAGVARIFETDLASR